MEYEVREALARIQRRVIEAAVHQTRVDVMKLLNKVLTDVLVVQMVLDAKPAASDSPSQSLPEKPSEPSTCEAGESDPRKVWVVHQKPSLRLVGLFSTGDAAYQRVSAGEGEFTVNEYEVADG